MCQVEDTPATRQLHWEDWELRTDEVSWIPKPGHEQHRAYYEPGKTRKPQQVGFDTQFHRLVYKKASPKSKKKHITRLVLFCPLSTKTVIGELTIGLESLKHLENFHHLYLMGNPCTEFPNYRQVYQLVGMQTRYHRKCNVVFVYSR